MTIFEKQQEIIQEFKQFDSYESWEPKYDYIIDYAGKAKKMDDSLKIEGNIIRGCQTRVWIHTELKDGKVYVFADAEGKIIKGLVTLVAEIFNNSTPDEILNSNCDFIKEIGFEQFLSVNRSNGFLSMIERVRDDAKKYAKKLGE